MQFWRTCLMIDLRFVNLRIDGWNYIKIGSHRQGWKKRREKDFLKGEQMDY